MKWTFLMKFNDGKTFSAYIRSNLHSGYITKLKEYLPLGSQKFMNGYLGIHTDGLMCLNLWQIVAKIIEEYFSKS